MTETWLLLILFAMVAAGHWYSLKALESMNRAIDRCEERLDRIERRLDLVDTH